MRKECRALAAGAFRNDISTINRNIGIVREQNENGIKKQEQKYRRKLRICTAVIVLIAVVVDAAIMAGVMIYGK
ncbi:MAG: hypothetical protein ACRCUT_14595 [Spirochaetota bacterium]